MTRKVTPWLLANGAPAEAWVLSWTHKHGTDVFLAKDEDSALALKAEIALLYFEDELEDLPESEAKKLRRKLVSEESRVKWFWSQSSHELEIEDKPVFTKLPLLRPVLTPKKSTRKARK